MKKWPIALQVYSVRDFAANDFKATALKIKEMGYDGVELAGTYGMKAVECKAILDKVGLELVCAHVGIDLIEDDEALRDFAATGMKLIAIPGIPGPTNEEELTATIARIKAAGERCKALGMQLLYHNHDVEFKKIGDQSILDTYYSEIPADLLQTELDTCWVNVAGEKPAPYVRKYTGRAPVVHLKDFSGQKGVDFAFRPVGYGVQDIPSIVAAAEDAGAAWLIVEQDMPSMNRTSLECAEMSVKYLHSFL